MAKLQKLSDSQYTITVPVQLVRALGLEEGDDLTWKVSDERELELKT